MYVAVVGSEPYKYVELRQDVYNPATGKTDHVVVKRYGRLSTLVKEDPLYVEKLKAEVDDKRKAEKEDKTIQAVYTPKDIKEVDDQNKAYAFGHMIVLKLWKMMKLDSFFEKNVTAKNKNELIQGIYTLLASRLGSPTSIRGTSKKQKGMAGVSEITMDVLYSVLDVFVDAKEALLTHLSKFFQKNTSRKMDTVSYDVTNYYFESQKPGEFRLFGYSKEHKNNEVIVVMGLLIDSNGIPITMRLFPGNTMDQNTLQDSIDELEKLYGFNSITVIADRGMNSGENLVFLTNKNHHFLISYTLKKASDEIKEQCLKGEWDCIEEDRETGEMTFASKIIDTRVKAKIAYTEEELKALKEERKKEKKKGRLPKYKTVEVDAKLHVTYDSKRAKKDASDRERQIEKVLKRVSKSGVSSVTKYGANKYLNIEVKEGDSTLNQDKINEDSKWDGYYAIITDKEELSSKEVGELYHGQWKIEECFRILKTDLEARPVYVWKDEHIQGHFMMCYVALCMIRYLQYYLRSSCKLELSAGRIMDAIESPRAVVTGTYPQMIVIPTCVNEDFLTIIDKLGLKNLKSEMTLVNFRAVTQLDLVPQVSAS